MLSEFAGAAKELRQAYLVNPHDINGLKTIILAVNKTPPQQVPPDADDAAKVEITTSSTGPVVPRDLSKLGPGSDY